MNFVIRKGSGQTALDLHALNIGSTALSVLRYSEGEVKALHDRFDGLFAGEATALTGDDPRAAIEYLRGRPLSLHYRQDHLDVCIPFLFDGYTSTFLTRSGANVLGFPLHRLEQATVGDRCLSALTFRKKYPSEQNVSSVSFALADAQGIEMRHQVGEKDQRAALDRLMAVQRKVGEFIVPLSGENVPPMDEVLALLRGRALALEWFATAVDPVWRVVSDWVPIAHTKAEGSQIALAGPGWHLVMSHVAGWRVSEPGLILDTVPGEAGPRGSITLALIR